MNRERLRDFEFAWQWMSRFVLCGVTPRSFDRWLPTFQGQQLPCSSSKSIDLRWVQWKSWALVQSAKMKRLRKMYRNIPKIVNGVVPCLSFRLFFYISSWQNWMLALGRYLILIPVKLWGYTVKILGLRTVNWVITNEILLLLLCFSCHKSFHNTYSLQIMAFIRVCTV
jgi:hypothetical protein